MCSLGKSRGSAVFSPMIGRDGIQKEAGLQSSCLLLDDIERSVGHEGRVPASLPAHVEEHSSTVCR